MIFIRLIADFKHEGGIVPAGATGSPMYMPPAEGRPSCFTRGVRIGLSHYCILTKRSKGIEKLGTVTGKSEDGGGLPGEWCHFIEVQWDDGECGRLHPHNILREPNTYRFQWDTYKPENDPFRGSPRFSKDINVLAIQAGAQFDDLDRIYGAT